MIKLKFKNSINGNVIDWTNQSTIFDVGSLKRRLESRNPGETGIIVFDKLPVTLGFEAGSNVVYDAFSGDLSAAQKYIFQLYGIREDKTERKVFEGLTDFSTIEWPDLEKKVSFNALDKLSALELVTPAAGREIFSTLARVIDIPAQYRARILDFLPSGNGNYFEHKIFFVEDDFVNNTGHGNLSQVMYQTGEIFIHPEDYGLPELERRTAVVTESSLEFLSEITVDYGGGILRTYNNVTYNRLVLYANDNKVYFDADFGPQLFRQYAGAAFAPKVYDHTEYAYYEKYYYNTEIFNTNSFDAIKLVEAIVKQQWTDVVIINRTGQSTFPLSLNYYKQFIDGYPLGKHPLDAIKMLAQSMRCYIFFNSSGELVLQKKNNLTAGTARNYTPSRKRSGGKKKLFWDKLADAVSVTIKSGLLEDGAELIGTASLQKFPGIKPRNEIKVECVAPASVEFNQQAFDDYAMVVAQEVMDFYGKRHYHFTLNSDLLDDMYDWELLDLITINGEQYFILSIDLNLFKMPRSASFELVSVNGYDYDYQQAQTILSPVVYNSTSGGNVLGGTAGGGAAVNYTFTLPLYLSGNNVSIKNLAVDTGNIIAQRDGSTPQEYRIYNSYIDENNNEFVSLGYKNNADVFTIESEKSGIGLIRNMAFMGAANYGFGTADFDGIPAAARVVIKGSSDDGSTNILAGRDSNEANVFTLDSDGNISIETAAAYKWFNRSVIKSPSSGNLTLFNHVLDDFGLLQFGGVTSLFPAIKRNAVDIEIKLADDSAFSNIKAASLKLNDYSIIKSTSAGNIILSNNLLNDFGLLQFGGVTDSFPAIKRNTTDIEIKLADDSALSNIKAVSLKLSDYAIIKSTVAGNVTVFNNTLNDFGLLQFGGVTSSFPAIKRSTSEILFRLADDSADANIQAGNIKVTGHIGTQNYVSQLTGWRINNLGAADFRYVYTDELHAKSFMADLEQALAGAQIICKSVAKVAADYSLPLAGNSSRLIVESFGGFETAAVFQDGDLVRLRQFTRTSGELVIADAWGNVVLDTSYGFGGFDTATKTQAYTFTRHATVPGNASGVIKEGTLALDYGVSGNGFIEANAIDGVWASNSPYHQIVTWSSLPGNYTIHNRTGKLTGITDNDFGGTLPANFGTYINGTAFIKGNIFVKATNALALQNSAIQIGNITGTANNAIKIAQTGTTSTSGMMLYDASANELLKFALNGDRHIANWFFDKDKFYKSNVRLESTEALKGLAVNDGTADVLKVGEFTNASETYYTSAKTLGAWTFVQNSHSDVLSATVNGDLLTLDPYSGSGWTGGVTVKYKKSFTAAQVADKTLKITLETAFEEDDYNNIEGRIYAYVKVDGVDYNYTDVTPTNGVQAVPVTFQTFNFYCNIPNGAASVEFYVQYLLDTTNGIPCKTHIQNISAISYDKTIIELNQSGFKSWSSPIAYTYITPNRTEFSISQIKATNLFSIGDWNLRAVPRQSPSADQYYLDLVFYYKNVQKGYIRANDGAYYPGGIGGSSNLDALTDVTITSPQDGQIITYNSALGQWINSAGGSIGEANTASNYGAGGVGVFDSKSGVDLRFRNINAASNRISVTLDNINHEVDIDVNQANLTLIASQIFDFNEALDDRVAALMIAGNITAWTYVDVSNTLKVDVGYNTNHFSVSTSQLQANNFTISAGSGLSGGGSLTLGGSVSISHTDTSSQPSVDNSGATVIQDVTLDTYGHVTALGSVNMWTLFSGTSPIVYNSTNGNISLTQSGDILGTANQVSVTGGTDILPGTTNVTLSLPQDIHSSASPVFNNLTLSGDVNVNGGDILSSINLNITPTGNLTLNPTGDIYLNPAGNDVLPGNNSINLGLINKKYLTLHAAELWVNTLVAQSTAATIGGRIIISIATELVEDFLSTETTYIYLKHNNLTTNDIVFLESDNKIEFIRINSTPTYISTNKYRYTFTRNLDNTGANDWYAGDAVVSTGTTNEGFIDIYSVHGLSDTAQYGPAIVGNVRNSLTYNDWAEYWAIGNLNGLYGKSTDTYGIGLGKYALSGDSSYMIIDSTNGIQFYKSGTQTAKWAIDGTITIGQTSAGQSSILMSSGALKLRTGTTDKIVLNVDGSGFIGSGNISWNTSGVLSASGWQLDAARFYKYIDGSHEVSIYAGNYPRFEVTYAQGDGNFLEMGRISRGPGLNTYGIQFYDSYYNKLFFLLSETTKRIGGWNFSETTLSAVNNDTSIIQGGTIVGSILQTATSGQRVVINPAYNAIFFYDNQGYYTALYGSYTSTTELTVQGVLNSPSGIRTQSMVINSADGGASGFNRTAGGVVALTGAYILKTDGLFQLAGSNLYLSNATNKYITLGASGAGAPAVNSLGTKLILYSGTEDTSNNPRYAFGVAASELWYASAGAHKWYKESSGTWSALMVLDASGVLQALGGYKSVDGSAGVTQTRSWTVGSLEYTLVVKNGIVTSFTATPV